jgi:putative PEP-CTERM system TPR-repeat lipoprotein
MDPTFSTPKLRLTVFAVLTGLVCITLSACGPSPADAPARLAAGDRHMAADEIREAVIEYRNAVQADPTLGEARTKLAVAYEKLGDGANALEEYIRAADLLPKNLTSQLVAGRYLLAARRTAEALSRADAVLALDSQNVDGHVLRGNALGGLNELDRALSEMEEALRLDPTRGVTYTQLGLVEAARGQAMAAETAFRRAIELAPNEVGSHLALANFYWSSGRLSEAETALEAALDLDPNSESTNRALAVFSLASGRVEQAERYLKRVSDLSRAPSSIFTLAEYYIATRRSAKAVELLEPLVLDPRITGTKQRLARAYAAAGQAPKAYTLIEEILTANPKDSATLLLKGQLLLEESRREEALPVVKAAVAAEPTSIAAQFTLGRVYAARGDTDGAKAAFRAVLKQNPSATAAQIELATIELSTESGNSGAAVRALDNAAKDGPSTLDSRIAIVRGLLKAQEFDRAERELRALTEQAPDVAAVHVQSGVLAASRNNVSGAKAAFERALSIDRESIEAFGGLLALDLNRKDFAAAKQRVDRRLESETAPSAALLLLAGRTYASANDLPATERVLRRAIETDATLLPAYELLAQVYYNQNRLDDARREFDNLAQRHSMPASALTMSGLLFQASGNNTEAQKRFEQAVAADDRAVVAANNLAWMYADSGQRLSEALRLARTAAELVPNNSEVLDTLGWVYLKSSLPALAVAPLVRAAAINPKHAGYQYRLGLAYAGSGDVERSRTALNRALELDRAASWADDARRVLAGLTASHGR